MDCFPQDCIQIMHFDENNTGMMHSFHIKSHMMLICPITSDINLGLLVKEASSRILHCKVTVLLLLISKCVLGSNFVTMSITCTSSKLHPLTLTSFADPCLRQLLWWLPLCDFLISPDILILTNSYLLALYGEKELLLHLLLYMYVGPCVHARMCWDISVWIHGLCFIQQTITHHYHLFLGFTILSRSSHKQALVFFWHVPSFFSCIFTFQH